MEKYNGNYYFKKVKEIWARGRDTLGWGKFKEDVFNPKMRRLPAITAQHQSYFELKKR